MQPVNLRPVSVVLPFKANAPQAGLKRIVFGEGFDGFGSSEAKPAEDAHQAESSVLETQRRAVLEKVFFWQGSTRYTGRKVLELVHEVLNEKQWDRVKVGAFDSYLIFADDSWSTSREIRKGLHAAIRALDQVDLLSSYSYNDYWHVSKTNVGRKLMGEPSLEATKAAQEAAKKAEEAKKRRESVLGLIKEMQQADLKTFAETLKLNEMKVLTANYEGNLTGWDVLALVEELDRNRGWLARLWQSGVEEAEITRQFALDSKKQKILQGLGDLKDLGKLETFQDSKGRTRWRTTQDGKATVAAGDPVKTGTLTNDVLERILQHAVDKLRTEKEQESAALAKFEQDAGKAFTVLEQSRALRDTQHRLALEKLAEADTTADQTEKQRLEEEAARYERAAQDIQYKIELEEEFFHQVKEHLDTARQKYETWLGSTDANIRKLVTAQARIRLTQVNQGIGTLMKEMDELSKQEKVPSWASVVSHVNLEYYVARAALGDEEDRRVQQELKEFSSEKERNRILARLRAEQQRTRQSGTEEAAQGSS